MDMMNLNLIAGILMVVLSSTAAEAQEAKRYELGVFGTYSFLEKIGSTDHGVGTQAAGIGGRFVYRALPFLDLESDITVLPGNSATAGNHLQGLFGAKAGLRTHKIGLFVKARPGFMHFSKDPFGVSKTGTGADFFSRERASSTEPNLDVGGVVEYYTVRGVILRFDLGDSIIRYAPRMVRVSDFVPPFEAGGFTTHNWQGSFGVSFRF